MKISLFYEFAAAPAVGRRRRAPAVPGRSRRGRGRRQGRLLHRLADRAPLPRGVLPLHGAGDVPGRGEPAHQGHPARASASCTCRRRSTTRRGSPSGSPPWTTCPMGASSSAPARAPRSANSVASTSTPPTSAASGRRRSRSRSAAWSRSRSPASRASTSRCPPATSSPSRCRSRTRRCGWPAPGPSSVQMAAQKAIGALSFAYTGPEAAQGPGQRLLQGIRGARRARHAGDQPEHPGHRRRPVDDGRPHRRARRSSASVSAAASSRSASCTTT